MTIRLSGQTAITGIGATEFSKQSGRSELQLACEAVASAIADAGLPPDDVDGLVTYSYDKNLEIEVARNVGIRDLGFVARSPYGGGGACSGLLYGAMAVACGVANNVVYYRAFNERSEARYTQGFDLPSTAVPGSEDIQLGWYTSFGLRSAAAFVALHARRYMHDFGATTADFGRISVNARANAATNPAAWFYGKPIDLEDHQRSPWIAEPLRMLDCCQESDGGVAILITSLERARDLPNPPAVIAAASQAAPHGQEQMSSYQRESLSTLPEMGRMAERLWEMSGMGPGDIDVAMLYDHFTPFVLMQLEAMGFCDPGESPGFVADGNIALDGRLPVNPNGGLIAEAYIHGLNNITEGVRQIRGTAANQIGNSRHVLVTGGAGVPSSGAILVADRG